MYKTIVITLQNYTDAEVHTITVVNGQLFWVKMIDIEKGLGIQNISDLVRKNIKGIFETKNPTKKQIGKCKCSQKEISKKLTDDSKIKYARNDRMENIIKNCRGVKNCSDGIHKIEKEKQRQNFRALLGFKEHDKMLNKKYSTKLKIKKIFSNEIMEEQYRILGYFIDLGFPVHKLGLEVNENCHMVRSEAKEEESQNRIEKQTGFTIITINPNKENFDIFFKIVKMKNYIIESTKKITKESTKKSIIDDVEKLLKVGSNFINNAAVSKFVKNFARHLLPTI